MTNLATLVTKYSDDLESMMRLSCSVITAKVLTRTPILSGSLRASWTPNKGKPIANNVTINEGDPIPARNKAAPVINSLRAGDTYSLANGKPYVRRIEYEGWSKYKEPAGMLRVSVAEWDGIVAASVARYR